MRNFVGAAVTLTTGSTLDGFDGRTAAQDGANGPRAS
jgi:hypothetical protein